MKIIIPDIPKSLNQFAGRKNDREYQAHKREWKEMVYYICKQQKYTTLNRAIVTITYFFKDKIRRDPDNYSGKVINDGLTAAGVIKDDSFDCIELRLRGDCDKDNPRTEILIEEVEQ